MISLLKVTHGIIAKDALILKLKHGKMLIKDQWMFQEKSKEMSLMAVLHTLMMSSLLVTPSNNTLDHATAGFRLLLSSTSFAMIVLMTLKEKQPIKEKSKRSALFK